MAEQAAVGPEGVSAFPVGTPNDAFAQYFSGRSYLAAILQEPMTIANVTFEPGCRNNWHIHGATSGGGQILIATGGRGFCQTWGEPAREMLPGDAVYTPAGVKHWHGAAVDSWFAHLAIAVPGEDLSTEWLEPVDDEQAPWDGREAKGKARGGSPGLS